MSATARSKSTNPSVEKASDEATQVGLQLARQAGEAYLRMVDYFVEKVAECGAKQSVDDYLVGFAVEHAEPLYHLMAGQLKLAEPFAGANAHLEVVVADRGDGRFIPELHVEVTLLHDGEKGEIGTFHLPFLWHPTMYHYGCNVQVPGDGRYTARVAISTPEFPRHDKVNGKRYTRPVVLEFHDLLIKTGRK